MRSDTFNNQMSRLYPDDETVRCVTFQVTDDCNLRCTYCYQHNKGHHKMPFDIAKRFIDLLLSDKNPYINTSNTSGMVVEFIGGEPLLEVELIDEITTYLYNQMIQINHPWLMKTRLSICSNGQLYFDETVQKFLTKWAQMLSFNITVDGNKKLHDSCRLRPDGTGSYDVAIAGVKDWVSRGYYMGSKMTLAPANVMYTYEAVVSLIENGYEEINLNCVFEKGWTVEHAKILYSELKRLADYIIDRDMVETLDILMFNNQNYQPMDPSVNGNWCGGNAAMIAVDYKGDIYPCLRYMESSLGDKRKPLIIGNVFDGIETKQCERDCVACLKGITRKSQSTEECFNCPIASGCAWCTAYNYEYFGTPNKRATFICEMHKAQALANVYYWNKWYRKQEKKERFENNVSDEWALNIISEEELNLLKELAKKEE